MINNTINMIPLFKNNISKKVITDKKTNILNTLKNKNLNTNNISDSKLLIIYIKALKLYINNLSSYKLKWNNKKLITTLKNKPLITIDHPLSNINKQTKTNIVTKNENLTEESITKISLNNNNLPNNSMNNKNKDKVFFNHIELLLKNKKEIELNKEKNINIIKKNKINATLFSTTNKNKFTTNKNKISEKTNQTQSISNYLKSITVFNSIPRGKIFTFSQQVIYKFNTVNKKIIKNLYTFLFYSFLSMNSLISKPILDFSTNKIIINLFFFNFEFKKNKRANRKNKFKLGFKKNKIKRMYKENEKIKKYSFITRNHKKLEIICKILSFYFKKPVELNLVRLKYPYFDSNIFVNLLALMINKKSLRFIMKRFFRFAVIRNIAKAGKKIIRSSKIPSFLSGIKIRIAGRLLTQRVIPRKTVKILTKGAYARGKINFLDVGRYTNKNRRGAFTITVTAGQNLIV
jgi:Mitochondrial ribosomal protein (VAR1)